MPNKIPTKIFYMPTINVPMIKLVIPIIKHWLLDVGVLPPVPEVKNLMSCAV